MPQMTLLTGPERRRRWNEEDRCRILAAAFSPGAVVADVARRFDATSLIYKWRRAYLTPSGFAPAVVVDAPALSAPEPMIPEPMIPEPQGPSILVELSNGTRVSVSATAPASLVTAASLSRPVSSSH